MRRRQKLHILMYAIILLVVMVFYVITNFKTNKKEDERLLDISIYRVEEVTKRNIDDRETLRVDGNIFVGNSKKELENGYYDLKIVMCGQTIDIHINKAWKEFNDTLYEEVYIKQIVNSIISIFEIDIKNMNSYNKIYEYIVQGYKASKGLIDSRLDDNNKLNVEGVEFKKKIENNELVLSISKEVDK